MEAVETTEVIETAEVLRPGKSLLRENHLGALACPCRAVAAFLYYHLVNEFETRNYLVELF